MYNLPSSVAAFHEPTYRCDTYYGHNGKVSLRPCHSLQAPPDSSLRL